MDKSSYHSLKSIILFARIGWQVATIDTLFKCLIIIASKFIYNSFNFLINPF